MTAQPHTAAPDANDILMGGGGAPTAKFLSPGDTVGGRIIAPPRSHHEREFDRNNPGKGAPKYFPSGDPIYGITIDVQTNLRDPSIDGDTGIRRIYVEGKRLKDTVRDAVYASGSQKLEVGGELHVTFTGHGVPSTPGINAPKEYEARYLPPGQAAVFGQQQTPAPQAAQPAVQQAPPPAQPVTAAPAAQDGPPQPSPEQLAAVRSAGVDPKAAFPHWNGQG